MSVRIIIFPIIVLALAFIINHGDSHSHQQAQSAIVGAGGNADWIPDVERGTLRLAGRAQ